MLSSLLLVVAVLCSALHASLAELMHFDAKVNTFDNLVSTSDSLWFVATNYAVTEEKGMEEVEALMESLSTKLRSYDINVGVLDCTKAELKKVCSATRQQASSNSPVAFALYFDRPKDNPYTHIKYREPVVYAGIPSSSRDVDKFINKQLQPKNMKIVEFENVKNSVDALQKPAILVFSEKKSNPNLFLRSIFAKYGQLEVFFVPTPDKDSRVEEFQYDNLPSMFFIDPPKHEKAAKFEGEMTDRPAFLRWIDTVLSTSSISEAAGSSSGSSSNNNNGGTAAASAAQAKGIKMAKVTEEFLKDLLTKETSESTPAATTGTGKSKANHEAVVAVVSTSAKDEIVGWEKALQSTMMGSIAPLEIICDADSSSSSSESSEATNSIGSQLCKDRVDGKPYLFFIPYHATLNPGKYYKMCTEQYKYKTVDNEDWVKIVGKTLPESSVEMLPEDENAINYFMQQSIARETLPVVIFSQKSSVSSVVRNVALGTPGKLAIGFVYMSSEESTLHLKFGVQSLPAVIAMQPQLESDQMKANRLDQEKKAGKKPPPPGSPQPDEDQPMVMVVPRPYSTKLYGPLTYANLKTFSLLVLDSGYYPTRKLKEENPHAATGTGIKTISPVDVEDQAAWLRECPASFRGLCIVYLHDGKDEMVQSGKSLLEHLGSSEDDPSKTLRDAMKLVNMNVACQYNFLSIFGIDQSSLPLVLVISPFRLKYSMYRGSITNSAVGDFVSAIFKGQGSTAPLSALPTLDDRSTADFSSCLQQMSEGGGVSSGQADEDDEQFKAILEEIKREEEEKKKLMAEEEKARKLKEKEDKLKAEQEAKNKKSSAGDGESKKKKKKKKAKKDEL